MRNIGTHLESYACAHVTLAYQRTNNQDAYSCTHHGLANVCTDNQNADECANNTGTRNSRADKCTNNSKPHIIFADKCANNRNTHHSHADGCAYSFHRLPNSTANIFSDLGTGDIRTHDAPGNLPVRVRPRVQRVRLGCPDDKGYPRAQQGVSGTSWPGRRSWRARKSFLHGLNTVQH
jgi:hypothetical protein